MNRFETDKSTRILTSLKNGNASKFDPRISPQCKDYGL